MPTESQYRIAAKNVAMQLTGLGALDAQHRTIASEPGVEGGTAGPAIGEAIAVNLDDLATLASRLAALEHELDRRANQCAQFTDDWYAWRERHLMWQAALDRHRSSLSAGEELPHPGGEPDPPRPPFPEAEVG